MIWQLQLSQFTVVTIACFAQILIRLKSWRVCEAQSSLIQFASHSKCGSHPILEFKKTHRFWMKLYKDPLGFILWKSATSYYLWKVKSLEYLSDLYVQWHCHLYVHCHCHLWQWGQRWWYGWVLVGGLWSCLRKDWESNWDTGCLVKGWNRQEIRKVADLVLQITR